MEYSPQMLSNLYKSFTSDVIRLSQKKKFLALRAIRFTLSWRYIIVISFIDIGFVVVKLKISEVLRTNSASTNSLFWGFWALIPPIYSNIAKILNRDSTLVNKNTVWKLFGRIRLFTEKGQTQSWHFWSNFDPSFPPKDGQNRKKQAVVRKNFVYTIPG